MNTNTNLSKCTLSELLGILSHIDKDNFRERYENVLREVESRKKQFKDNDIIEVFGRDVSLYGDHAIVKNEEKIGYVRIHSLDACTINFFEKTIAKSELATQYEVTVKRRIPFKPVYNLFHQEKHIATISKKSFWNEYYCLQYDNMKLKISDFIHNEKDEEIGQMGGFVMDVLITRSKFLISLPKNILPSIKVFMICSSILRDEQNKST